MDLMGSWGSQVGEAQLNSNCVHAHFTEYACYILNTGHSTSCNFQRKNKIY
jgi:hypothetical protein